MKKACLAFQLCTLQDLSLFLSKGCLRRKKAERASLSGDCMSRKVACLYTVSRSAGMDQTQSSVEGRFPETASGRLVAYWAAPQKRIF